MPRVANCPDVRLAVLDAASHLMERYGYKKMTIDDIASEIGIGKATLYGYFQNKQDVALAVIDRYHQDIQDGWIAIAESNKSPSEKVQAMILDRVLYLFDVAQRHWQSLDDCLAQLRPLVLSRRDHYNAVEAEILGRALRQGCLDGSFICADVIETASTMLSCTAGLMPLNLSSRELSSREEVIEKTRKVTNLLLRAIAADDRRDAKI